jgi:hypothetical protein
MTFKHVNFEDSSTMRSLAKVAKEKGWLSESLTKTASQEKKPDYSATGNLTINIVKLCSGLREFGFNKYADELEEKFINYKRAASSYETSKEKGEDLVDTAHPDGSHKLEGVEGDSLIETIVDQQLKDILMVNKAPTGKLAKDILSAVKIVLSQEGPSVQKSLQNVISNLDSALQIFNDVGFLSKPATSMGNKALELSKAALNNPNIDALRKIQVSLKIFRSNVKPVLFSLLGGVSGDTYDNMVPYLDEADKSINQAISLLQQKQEMTDKKINTPEAPKEDPKISGFNSKIDEAIKTARRWIVQIQTDSELNDNDKNSAKGWLNKKILNVLELKKEFDGLSPDDKVKAVDGLLVNLNKLTTQFPAFQAQWID